MLFRSNSFGEAQQAYFERIDQMQLQHPQIVGFGISNAETFQKATKFAKGAIIGSAFIKHLTENGTQHIDGFIKQIRM